MPLQAGVGFSSHPNVLTAAQEAVARAKAQLKKEHVDAAFLFNTAHYDPKKFLPILAQSLNPRCLIGCLTSEIIIENRFEPAGIAVLLLTSDQIKFESGRVSHLTVQDLRAAGKTFVRNCLSGLGISSRKLLLFFIDGLIETPSAFLGGIKEEFGRTIPVIGVGSSAPLRHQKTYQYHLDEILSAGACGLILSENCRLGMSCQHGWKPLGQPRKITGSRDNVILTIDHKKAISIYEELLGGRIPAWDKTRLDNVALRYPLGLQTASGQGYVVRNVTAKLDDGSIVCQDKVSDDTTVHILLGNKRSCLQAAEQAAYEVREQLGGTPPRLIFVMESLLRRSLLGRSSAQEIRLIQNILGETVPLIGMCSQKEIFATLPGKSSEEEIHNSSLMILAIA